MIIYKVLIIFSLISFMTGCSDDNTSPTSISVTTISGVKVTLSGSYETICTDDGSGNGFTQTNTIDGNMWTFTVEGWTADLSCAGNPDTSESVSGILSASNSDISISGWVLNDGSPATAPTAADGSGSLSSMESVTPLTVIITSAGFGFAVGNTGSLFYVVDDTTSSIVLYQDDDAASNSNAVSDMAYVQ